eukprot:XP_014025115.1 PREDICTED: ral guanine nucleotide dissociation stimulator-like 1 isoform X2 [Salmo salar]
MQQRPEESLQPGTEWRVVEERKPAVKIREGTLERLVQTQLMAFRDNKLAYTIIFLSTYRAFASTHTVQQLLLDNCSRR